MKTQLAWSLKRLIIAFDLQGWSGSLGDRRIDGRNRYTGIPEDKIYKVTNCDDAIKELMKNLPKYSRRHNGINLK